MVQSRALRAVLLSHTARRACLAVAAAGAAAGAAGCRNATAPSPLAGTYRATTFHVTAPEQSAPTDVLGKGGGLTLSITSDHTVRGTLVVPEGVPGLAARTADMTGTAELPSAHEVRFRQAAPTFVGDLVWTADGNTLRVLSMPAGGATVTGRVTVTLTR